MSDQACPKCGKTSGLWEGVTVVGWRSIGGSRREQEVDWGTAEADGDVGCGECNWEGIAGDLHRPCANCGQSATKLPFDGRLCSRTCKLQWEYAEGLKAREPVSDEAA